MRKQTMKPSLCYCSAYITRQEDGEPFEREISAEDTSDKRYTTGKAPVFWLYPGGNSSLTSSSRSNRPRAGC